MPRQFLFQKEIGLVALFHTIKNMCSPYCRPYEIVWLIELRDIWTSNSLILYVAMNFN